MENGATSLKSVVACVENGRVSAVRLKSLPLSDVTERDVAAWTELAGTAVEPNVFFEAPYVLAAHRALREPGVRLLVVADGDRWLAALPVRRVHRWHRMPLRVLGTWLHKYCYLGTPLVAAGREEEAARHLVRGLRPHGGPAALELLIADGPVMAALAGAFRSEGVATAVWDRYARASLDRRPQPDYIETTLRSKRRRELRRQRGHLAEAAGGGELTTADESADPSAVDRFLALEASGWKGRSETALSAAHDDGFFRAVCDRLRAEGRLQLLALRSGDRTVAMKCNFAAGDGAFCFKIAHDEELGKFSPGVQLELDNVQVFHARPELRWMDSCADPNHPMIDRLWPDRRQLVSLLLAPRSLAGLPAWGQARAAVELRRRMKERTA